MANPSSTRAAEDQKGEVRHGRIIPETWGDVLIKGLWEIHTDAIIDIRFGDADGEIYVKEGMDTIFTRWEKMKKDKHGWHCQNQGKHFSLLVLSVDEIMGKETRYFESTYGWKMEKPILHVKGWVNCRIEIAIARL